MELLTDQELKALCESTPPIVEGMDSLNDWQSKSSPIQASSVDLHIGSVFLPGTEDNELGSAGNPRTDHALETGETCVVATKENLCFPSDIAAIGFPPSRVSSLGLLMTNPGHVDPGYRGPLRFTVINMGSECYSLKKGDPIVTLLIMKLGSKPQADWTRRNGVPGQLPTQEKINKLSKDFVDVERRAVEIARKEVEHAELGVKQLEAKWQRWAVIATIVVAIISGVLVRMSNVDVLNKKIDLLEQDVRNRIQVEEKIEKIDRRVGAMEDAARKRDQKVTPRHVMEDTRKGPVKKP
jgi:dCTP deaminase